MTADRDACPTCGSEQKKTYRVSSRNPRIGCTSEFDYDPWHDKRDEAGKDRGQTLDDSCGSVIAGSEPEGKSPRPGPSEPRDALRERVEREMLACVENGIRGYAVPVNEAIAVAVRMVEEVDKERRALLNSHGAEGLCQKKRIELVKRAEAAEKDAKEYLARRAKAYAERDEAVKALAEARGKWGHIEGCKCHAEDWKCVETDHFYLDKAHEHPWRDPRCAPEGRGE